MSNSEHSWNPDRDHGAEGPCRAGDLRNILNTIVAQLADADKRHSASLGELQTRIAAMGRDAQSIRGRVPPQYVPAFERIEAGVREIAQRLVDPSAEPRPAPAPAQDTPMALRSGRPFHDAGPNKRDEEPARRSAAVDNFDVIESSLPGNVSDPWDRSSAEALSSHYESGAAGFAAKLPGSRAKAGEAQNSIDQAWLETRFAGIAKGIEQSLADIKPDRGFFALGQRFDQFEQQFSNLVSSVATQSDLGGIRLIENQVNEVVGQLTRTQDQLARLGVIEDQLATISSALADVHQAATASMDTENFASASSHASGDTDAIARAADLAARKLAALMQSERGEQHDLRPLIEQFMSESRQGEENTAALLDTMQQAMIRILDRVDSIEFTQHQNAASTPAPQEYVREQVRFVDQSHGSGTQQDSEADNVIDAAVAAVASAKSMSPMRERMASEQEATDTESQEVPPRPQRAQEKSRQDFIAEARRAKMRLASAHHVGDEIVMPEPFAPAAEPVPRTGPAQGSRPIRSTAEFAAKMTGPSAPSPRIVIMAVAALMALGGLWYSLDGDQPSAVKPVALSPTAAQAGASNKALPKPEGDAAQGATQGDEELKTIQGGQPSDGTGPRSDAGSGNDTEGQIVASDAAAGKTTLPMLGVAVDMERPFTENDLQQARRHEAMASISGQLGVAAARSSGDMQAPAILMPQEDDTKAKPSSLNMSSKEGLSSRLDMPPASVGPLSLRLAAAGGDRSAQFDVGARFAEGKGATQNFAEAAKWYQRAADQNSAQAQYRLGTLYERGMGVRADAAQAAVWYRRAAEQGNVKSMHNLAVLSANQSGQSPDYITASQWFERAAERGLSDSQFNLAILYENGLGVKADIKQAYKWLALAARGGDKEAVKRRDIIRGKMTADDMRAAEKLVAAWHPVATDKEVNDSRVAGEAWKKNPKNGISG